MSHSRALFCFYCACLTACTSQPTPCAELLACTAAPFCTHNRRHTDSRHQLPPPAVPSLITSEPWFLCVLLECDSAVNSELQISPVVPCFYFHQLSLTLVSVQIIAMVSTRRGSRLRPRVRFSTPEREEQAPVPAPVSDPVPAPVPEVVTEEPQGFKRYQTRMGPRAPSPVPQRRSRRARPSKQARTSCPGESSSSRPQPSLATSTAEATSSPQLSPASRIRRPLFVGNPIPGNVRLHRREFHQESYYDVPTLMADPRFRDSMRLIEHYSLLPFMRPRQYYYPLVVL